MMVNIINDRGNCVFLRNIKNMFLLLMNIRFHVYKDIPYLENDSIFFVPQIVRFSLPTFNIILSYNTFRGY